ncbi:hypothetical protein FEM03_13855 [Phragmitibacter flavus]|uniref:GRAM domain-containing protein n=1 Tax=Phragmitibacter flavus TaxID=2576071 RepID=A0A5R8KE93_9BACT|nr:hypothetical protein [Phragmitibacter flavus]TLD70265.1 hypothetical protein FEM03_13855 [Phragmitibacter flavus]
MLPVINQSKWPVWCAKKALPMQEASFALETCYYGAGWRTRPGTLLLTDKELIHHSYSWRDTHYAMFEPSLRVTIPMIDVAHVAPLRLKFGWRLLHGNPQSCFRMFMQDGTHHDLLLQRSGEEFRSSLSSRGIPIEPEIYAV